MARHNSNGGTLSDLSGCLMPIAIVVAFVLCSNIRIPSSSSVPTPMPSEDQIARDYLDFQIDMAATEYAQDKQDEYMYEALDDRYTDDSPANLDNDSYLGYSFDWWDGVSDLDCNDFMDEDAAQAFFEWQGGPAKDSHMLDADRDGLACESLP
jgi:hypothetical protein